jgi:uncharacterized phage-associated protein
MPDTVNAHLVADWFIFWSREAGDPITNLKVQKLVYYAQAWHAALFDDALFPESFEAWLHGPVCPPLYQRFKEFRYNPITAEIVEPEIASEHILDHLIEVNEIYGGYSAWDLERLTHSESPWREARRGLAPDAPGDQEISVESMRRYYKSLLDAAKTNPGT